MYFWLNYTPKYCLAMKFKISILLSLLFVFQPSFSQINQAGSPRNFHKSTQKIPAIILPSVNAEKLLEEDRYFEESRLKPLRFAQMIETDISPDKDGVWHTLDNGGKIWQLKIISPGAYSLSVVFNKYIIPQGAEVFIYNLKNKHILGAFTSLNNKNNKKLAIAPVKGDEIIIEYYEPQNVEFTGELHISSIGHDYKNIFNILQNNEKSFGSSGICNVNINCPEGDNWQTLKKSVCKITFNGFLCSGALVNNTKNNGNPYLLTANHCIDNSYDAENAVFYFNYESPTCDNIDGDRTQTLSGSVIKAAPTEKTLDFTLLELSEVLPPEYSPYFAGWSRDFADPSTVTSIHHPGGDIKKITIAYNGATTGDFGGEYTLNTHWWIDAWDVGTTEGGSSGSPLFDQNQRIIGDLTGGDASCSFNFNDYYQQFHHAWQDSSSPEQQLKAWLDPDSTGVIFIDGYQPYDTIPSHLKAWAEDTLVFLTWNEVVNHKNRNTFYIYRNNIKIDSTNNTSYIDSATVINSTYQYQVTAKFVIPDEYESKPSNKVYLKRMGTSKAPFYETFEDPYEIDINWYEERSNDSIGWIIQEGGQTGFLDTAYEGSFNAHFFNDNMEHSKLVSPKLDLTSDKNYLLRFYVHMPSYNNDVHKLNILYKKSDSLEWKTIRSFNYNISNWELKQIPLPDLSNNYRIAFEAIGLRGAGVSIDSVSIIEDTEYVNPNIFIGADSICLNDSVSISTDLDETYDIQWDFGSEAEPRNISGAGPHWIKYNSFGIKQISITVNDTYKKNIAGEIFVFDIPEKPTFTIDGNKLTSSADFNNQWYLDNEPIPGANKKTYSVEEDGEYFVAVTNYAGCIQYSDSEFITANSTDNFDVFVNEETTIKIYPNPNHGAFIIEFTTQEIQKESYYKLMDISGNLIKDGVLNSNQTHIKLRKSNTGIYFLQIIAGQQSKTYKILIQK